MIKKRWYCSGVFTLFCSLFLAYFSGNGLAAAEEKNLNEENSNIRDSNYQKEEEIELNKGEVSKLSVDVIARVIEICSPSTEENECWTGILIGESTESGRLLGDLEKVGHLHEDSTVYDYVNNETSIHFFYYSETNLDRKNVQNEVEIVDYDLGDRRYDLMNSTVVRFYQSTEKWDRNFIKISDISTSPDENTFTFPARGTWEEDNEIAFLNSLKEGDKFHEEERINFTDGKKFDVYKWYLNRLSFDAYDNGKEDVFVPVAWDLFSRQTNPTLDEKTYKSQISVGDNWNRGIESRFLNGAGLDFSVETVVPVNNPYYGEVLSFFLHCLYWNDEIDGELKKIPLCSYTIDYYLQYFHYDEVGKGQWNFLPIVKSFSVDLDVYKSMNNLFSTRELIIENQSSERATKKDLEKSIVKKIDSRIVELFEVTVNWSLNRRNVPDSWNKESSLSAPLNFSIRLIPKAKGLKTKIREKHLTFSQHVDKLHYRYKLIGKDSVPIRSMGIFFFFLLAGIGIMIILVSLSWWIRRYKSRKERKLRKIDERS